MVCEGAQLVKTLRTYAPMHLRTYAPARLLGSARNLLHHFKIEWTDAV